MFRKLFLPLHRGVMLFLASMLVLVALPSPASGRTGGQGGAADEAEIEVVAPTFVSSLAQEEREAPAADYGGRIC